MEILATQYQQPTAMSLPSILVVFVAISEQVFMDVTHQCIIQT